MSLTFDTNVKQRLHALAIQNKKASQKILLEAGRYMATKLELAAPYDPESRHKFHLQQSVTYDIDTENTDMVIVGFNDSESWRVHFIEFGTIRTPPYPFIEFTLLSHSKEVQRIIEQGLARELT